MSHPVEVYPRIVEVTARKRDGSLWKHRFSRRAAIVGNADGSLSIRAKGARLHKLFPFEGRQEPFLINPPLQILNPPRKRPMKRTMPEALRKYWAAKRAAKAKPRRRARRNPWSEKGKVARLTIGGRPAGTIRNSHPRSKNRGTNTLAPRHRRAALLGISRRIHKRLAAASRKTVAKKFSLMTSSSKEYPMAKRRKSHRRTAAHNPPRRRHFRRARRNPPFFSGAPNVSSLLKDGAAVAAGVVLPQVALRQPNLAPYADTPVKRAGMKLIIGWGISRLAKKFLGGERVANMVLVGTASNVLLAEVFPKVAPSLGVGLSDRYDPAGPEAMLAEILRNPSMLAGAYGRDGQLNEMRPADAPFYG